MSRPARTLPRTSPVRAALLAAPLAAPALFGAGCHGGSGAADLAAGPATPVESVSLGATVTDPALGAPVDLVRDQHGVPHVYGRSLPDVAFAEGYVMAEDRLPQMDLARHEADGTLTELLGDLQPSLLDTDIYYRTHHLRATAQAEWQALTASTDPTDQLLAKTLTSFAAGVNKMIAALQQGDEQLPAALAFVYQVSGTKPWTEVDSLLLGQLQAFQLAFDADTEIQRSTVLAADQATFAGASDPALAARAGIGRDLMILAPVDPTYTISGWTGMNGDTSTASLDAAPGTEDGNLLALLEADARSVRDVGCDHTLHPERGSNNWVIGPKLSSTGHAMVANDTHLALGNPATFYLAHLHADGAAGDATNPPLDVMGVQFPGIPGVILGMNEHVAWGATVNYIDVTDVYRESVVTCDDGQSPCVLFNGNKVALVPRVETFQIGKYGKISQTVTRTYYDVPQHGPIIPRVDASHRIEPLGQTELSIRYTGYEPANLFRAVLGLDLASDMKSAVAALDRDFKYGGQNWVIADDQGHFGWTQITRTPRRLTDAKNPPYLVMPGTGESEWGADLDPKYIPHAYDPDKGFLATANADPIGTTDDGDPWNEPTVDGLPLYLGASYDPGTRVGRITKRIEEMTAKGKTLSLDDLQSIQADAISEWYPLLLPTLEDAAQAISDELAKPGTHPAIGGLLAGASPFAKAVVPNLLQILPGYTFDTPSALDEQSPSPQQILDSQITTVMSAWLGRFADRALSDELAKMNVSVDDDQIEKLLVRLCTHPSMLVTPIAKETGDPVLFDDLGTPSVIEGKQEIAAHALLDAADFLGTTLGQDATKWRWGRLHTLTLAFPAGIAALDIPGPKEPYPNGYPRHGANGTVDVGAFGLSETDFSYGEGPAIRFVCELDPSGPKARNALPGGESFDPGSSHYEDQWQLWRANQTFDLAFATADVITSANAELAARQAAAASHTDDTNRPAGRVRFSSE